MFRVVPNYVSEEINRQLDAAIEECPDAAPDRAALYYQMLDAVDRLGYVPEFTLQKREP